MRASGCCGSCSAPPTTSPSRSDGRRSARDAAESARRVDPALAAASAAEPGPDAARLHRAEERAALRDPRGLSAERGRGHGARLARTPQGLVAELPRAGSRRAARARPRAARRGAARAGGGRRVPRGVRDQLPPAPAAGRAVRDRLRPEPRHHARAVARPGRGGRGGEGGALGGARLNAASLLLATWSIVAVDPKTQEVGAASASCIYSRSFTIDQTAELVPGIGAVVAQALANLDARAAIAAAMARGESPAGALSQATAPGADERLGIDLSRLRQYGVVTLAAGPVSYTGTWNGSWAGARAGAGVSVQGNILRGPEVVDEALDAFQAGSRACLAERLMRALEAGARAGGDRRCAPELGSLAAFVAVARRRDPPREP